MLVFMDSSAMEHQCHAKQSVDFPSEIDYKDADGKGCKNISAMSTMDTMPTLSDIGHDGDVKDHSTDDMDDMDEIDEYEHFSACERGLDEGRCCDIRYTDSHDDLFNEPFPQWFDDPLLTELHPEPIAPKAFSFAVGLHQNDEVVKVQKPFWKFRNCSSVKKNENTRSFCNRLLKVNKTKHDGDEDLEVKFLAKFSILTQIAQHADQAQGLFTASSKSFSRQVSAGPHFGRQVSAPDNDLDFAHGCGRSFTALLPSHCKSPASKHGPVDLVALDEAVEMDKECAGRASWKMTYDADQVRDSFMPDSTGFGRQVSARSRFHRQVSASVDDLNFDHGFRRQVTAPLPSRSESLTLKHELVDLDVPDEAVEIGAFAGPPGRALRKMAQHADRIRDPFMPDSKDFGRQVSAGPQFGRQVSAPVDDLKFARGFRRKVTAALPSHARSLTLKHVRADLVALDKAVGVDAVAGPPRCVLWKMAQHADQAQDPVMPNSKGFAQQVSARRTLGHQVTAPDNDLDFVHAFRRKVTTPLPSHPKPLRRFSSAA